MQYAVSNTHLSGYEKGAVGSMSTLHDLFWFDSVVVMMSTVVLHVTVLVIEVRVIRKTKHGALPLITNICSTTRGIIKIISSQCCFRVFNLVLSNQKRACQVATHCLLCFV